MKHILLTTIAAVVLVGCGESQEAKDRALFDAIIKNARDKYGRENTEAVKQDIGKKAFAIPSPERKKQKGWVLDKIPLS